LDLLIDDSWINEGYDSSAIVQELPTDPSEDPDDEICRFINEKFNIPYEQTVGSIRENNYDDITAIYFLLHDQKSNGKWSIPTTGAGLSPMSPMALQQGTSTPASRPSQMGTIEEDGAAVNLKAPAPAVKAPTPERRERSHTVAAG
jgi:MAP/microtubule affinity-regulating kinase